MKNAIFIAGMLLSSFVIRAGDISKYVLDNYLIPVGQSGSVVGRIYPTPSNVRLLSDTSSLFRIDLKEKSICLKKNRALSAGQTSYRYGITLLIDGQQCEFELLKDGFSKNRVVAHRGCLETKRGVAKFCSFFSECGRIGMSGV